MRSFNNNLCLKYISILDQPSPESLQVLRQISSEVPRARAPLRLALKIAAGDEFKELAKLYVLSSLQKGIPSLFADLKALYKDEFKRQTIETIVEESIKDQPPDAPTPQAEEPTTYLWTLYFLAQHHSYLGHHDRALSILETGMKHTPTLPDLHLFKARILKRCGDFLGAARCVNDARLLDGQDRFLNTKCGKYLLRADMIEEVSPILGLFTKVLRHESVTITTYTDANLVERRCESYVRFGGHAIALVSDRVGQRLLPYWKITSCFEAIYGDPKGDQLTLATFLL